VRADAPWCPGNIEFIRRINGLESTEEVRRIVHEASYLVMGLGDVYLGAPVATPLDPRHRLVTTKYNPARTWTPENAVGIGGAYMCVYGMEGPGGYQFVGRTIQMWNRFRTTEYFEPGKPWLLRFFDQIRFYPVTAAELLQLREDFPMGKASLKIEESEFDLAEYDCFLASNHESISSFKTQQREAFQAERRRWEEAGQLVIGTVPETEEPPAAEETLPEGCHAMASPLTGNLWKISVEAGARIEADQPLFIVESMKMENFVYAPFAGTVEKIVVKEGRQITQGQTVLVLKLF
jgi:urea carboxylase